MSSVGLTANQQLSAPDADLLSQIDLSRLPRHIAVIMDGNGRWARRRRLPRIAGHRAGASAVRAVVETSSKLGVAALSLYAFSAENWKRPRAEVNTLMTLLREYLHKEIAEIHRNNIRVQVLGRYEQLPKEVLRDLEYALQLTGENTGMVLNVALNYSARTELVDSFRAILKKVRLGQLREEDVDEDVISSHLYTRGLADPDLLIRTSGEMRVSNFLLWQIAYAEIWVTETLWPDFTRRDLYQAILDFQKRERRYGGLGHGGA